MYAIVNATKSVLASSLIRKIFLVGLLVSATAVQGQQEFRDRANSNTVGVISGSVKGTYARFAAELALRLDSQDELRVIPMLGKGAIQNMSDLLWLKGVDMAIVQSDVLSVIDRDGMAGVRNIHSVVRYITKLYDEEVHVIARKEITTLDQLSGRKISVGGNGTGTSMTSLLLLDTLGIEADTVNMSFEDTIAALKNGDLAAGIIVVGKPANYLLDAEADDQLHLLPVTLSPALEQQGYLAGSLTSKDYPGLFGDENDSIKTIAVGAILAVYNWDVENDKYRRLGEFSKRLLAELDYMKQNTTENGGPYHPKWAQVDPTIKVPAWQQFVPMSTLLSE